MCLSSGAEKESWSVEVQDDLEVAVKRWLQLVMFQGVHEWGSTVQSVPGDLQLHRIYINTFSWNWMLHFSPTFEATFCLLQPGLNTG